MIELFVVKEETPESKGLPFLYYLPDGKVVLDFPGEAIDFEPMKEFLDYEIKIVYYPTKELVNLGKGEVEIEVFDDVHSAYQKLPFIFPKNFL